MSLDLSQVATELLTDLASTSYVKIVRTTGATLDPVEGEYTGGTTTEIDCVGAVLSVADLLKTDSRVQSGDKMVIIDNAQTPTMDDAIKFGGNKYEIVSIDGFNHAGTQQFWRVICRD